MLGIDSSNCWLKNECNQCDCDSPSCIRLVKLDYLYNEANVSLFQRKNIELKLIDGINLVDKEAFTRLSSIKSDIVNFINEGNNLYLYSEKVGNGKTAWVIKLLQAYFNSIWASSNLECRALFIHVPQFLLALKDNISEKSDYIQHVKENILNCDLVIFDELTTRAGTNFELDHLLSYINTRLSSGKSCFYTSNVKPNELASYLGERLSSRVVNLSECIELKGEDLRAISKQLGGNK